MYNNRISDYTFEIKESQGRNVICIVDLNKGNYTVTNNIEVVLNQIGEQAKINLEPYMVVYRDTEGVWDGYDIKSRQFIPLRQLTEEEAIRKYVFRQLGLPDNTSI